MSTSNDGGVANTITIERVEAIDSYRIEFTRCDVSDQKRPRPPAVFDYYLTLPELKQLFGPFIKDITKILKNENNTDNRP